MRALNDARLATNSFQLRFLVFDWRHLRRAATFAHGSGPTLISMSVDPVVGRKNMDLRATTSH